MINHIQHRVYLAFDLKVCLLSSWGSVLFESSGYDSEMLQRKNDLSSCLFFLFCFLFI